MKTESHRSEFGQIASMRELRMARTMVEREARLRRSRLRDEWSALRTVFSFNYQLGRLASRINSARATFFGNAGRVRTAFDVGLSVANLLFARRGRR